MQPTSQPSDVEAASSERSGGLRLLLRWGLPAVALLVCAAAWSALFSVAATRPPGPSLLRVEGVDSEDVARRYRVRMQFAQSFHLAVEDSLWSLGVAPTGLVEIVRYHFATGELQRRWPIPPELAAPDPLAVAEGEFPTWRRQLIGEGGLLMPDGRLALLLSLWRGDRAQGMDKVRLALLLLDPGGGVTQLAALPGPVDARGFAYRNGRFELLTAECALWTVAEGKPAERTAESLCPFGASGAKTSEDWEQLAPHVEWAEPVEEGWSIAWSQIESEAEDGQLGTRAVFLQAPGGASLRRIGTLPTSVEWPFGGYLVNADGNVLNNGHRATHRLADGAIVALPPDPSNTASEGWFLRDGPSMAILHEGGMTAVHQWMLPTGDHVIEVGGQRLWIERPGPTIARSAGGGSQPLAFGWTLFNAIWVPSQDGGWVTNGRGEYVRLDAKLARADEPCVFGRLSAAMAGRNEQPSFVTSGREESDATWRFALGVAPLLMLFCFPLGLLLLAVGRWRRRLGLRALQWLAGAYLFLALALVDPFIYLLRTF